MPYVIENRKRAVETHGRKELRGVSPMGDLIRRERMKRGWTQQELAERSGLGQTAISAVERGANGALTHTRQRIANALGIPVLDLFVASGEITDVDVRRARRARSA